MPRLFSWKKLFDITAFYSLPRENIHQRLEYLAAANPRTRKDHLHSEGMLLARSKGLESRTGCLRPIQLLQEEKEEQTGFLQAIFEHSLRPLSRDQRRWKSKTESETSRKKGLPRKRKKKRKKKREEKIENDGRGWWRTTEKTKEESSARLAKSN